MAMMNEFDEWIWKDLRKIDEEFSFDKMRWLHKYPYPHAISVLRLLIQLACCCTNDVLIKRGREGILKIDRIWRLEHILPEAKECIDLTDDYDYQRFLELVDLSASELMQEVILIGKDSDNPENREAAQDFMEKYEYLASQKNECFRKDIIESDLNCIDDFDLAEVAYKYKALGMSQDRMYELLEEIRSGMETEKQEAKIRDLMDFVTGWFHPDWKVY